MSEHDLRIFAGRGPQGRRLVRPSRLSGAPLAAVRLGIEAAGVAARSATAAGPAAAADPGITTESAIAGDSGTAIEPDIDAGSSTAAEPSGAAEAAGVTGSMVAAESSGAAGSAVAAASTATVSSVAATGPGPQTALDHRLVQILEAAPAWNQTVDAAFRNKERALLEVFASLSCADATRLYHRLASPRAGDPVSSWLTRLVPERRARLLAYLAEAPRRAAVAKVRRA